MPGRPLSINRNDYEQLRRIHVRKAIDWAHEAGTDYWIMGSGFTTEPASSLQGSLLSENGWTTTSLLNTVGAGADAFSRTDQGTPPAFGTDAASDLLKSPAIFGDYRHARIAMDILGKGTLPRYLIADVHASFSVASANEATSGLGFFEDGGSPIVSADKAGAIESNGTYWALDVNATVQASTTAIDTSPHIFRVVIDRINSKVYGYVDGTNLYSAGITITQDEYPLGFGMGAGATNRVQLHSAHIFYAWNLPPYYAG